MSNELIQIEKIFNVPVEKLWDAITNNAAMKQWYFKLDEFKPEVGFEFRFLEGNEEKKYLHICKITEVIPNKKLSYSWRFDEMEGLSLLTFELFPEGEKTKLMLTHAGVGTFKTDNKGFTIADFTEGWTYIIHTSLKKFLEEK